MVVKSSNTLTLSHGSVSRERWEKQKPLCNAAVGDSQGSEIPSEAFRVQPLLRAAAALALQPLKVGSSQWHCPSLGPSWFL